jgi:lactate dehydrogenase-like 2-hydroxyacid dehydrogenase
MASCRRLVELANHVREGHWTRNIDETLYGCDVHGKTLGIVGYGRIGQALARRAALGFRMPVLYSNPRPAAAGEAGARARQVGLDELLASADIVALTLPLTDATRGLMSAARFAAMKRGAFFINGSRGAIVDEAALLAALDSGQLGGAGLDVFAVEPLPQDSLLRRHPRVTALPHIGSATHETRLAMAEMAVDNLLLVLAGQPALARCV